MSGLTAKVFRTYNASHTMSTLLKEMKATGTVAEKVKAYNDANRKVAILCNHKRTVGAAHANQMEKLSERVSLIYLILYPHVANHSSIDIDQRSTLPKMETQADDARFGTQSQEEERRSVLLIG